MILLSLLVLTGCSGRNTIEYPVLDGKIADMSEYGIVSAHFHVFSYELAVRYIEQGKTFIVFVGYPDCNFCRALVPYLDETCENKGMDVYYINAIPADGEIDEENRLKLVEYVKDHNSPDPDGNPTLWAPSIIYVQQGKVIGVHEGTVNTHNANEREMTQKEAARLEYLLNKQFDAILVRE